MVHIICDRFDLGDGYYLLSNSKSNGVGGHCDVNIWLFKGIRPIRRITNWFGCFLHYPGVKHGEWEEEMEYPFVPIVRYAVRYNPFDENGLADFVWTVQPDGYYWADDDGFGIENDCEVELCAKLDKHGRFVTQFMDRGDMKQIEKELQINPDYIKILRKQTGILYRMGAKVAELFYNIGNRGGDTI